MSRWQILTTGGKIGRKINPGVPKLYSLTRISLCGISYLLPDWWVRENTYQIPKNTERYLFYQMVLHSRHRSLITPPGAMDIYSVNPFNMGLYYTPCFDRCENDRLLLIFGFLLPIFALVFVGCMWFVLINQEKHPSLSTTMSLGG